MKVQGFRIKKQLEYLESNGIDIIPLLAQLGLNMDSFNDPTQFHPFEHYKLVLEFALRQTNDLNYGLDFGNDPRIGGTLGMMCASAKNLKEALIQGCKLYNVQGDFAEILFVEDKSHPKIEYKVMDSWLLTSPKTAKIEIDAMFSFINNILKVNSNNNLGPWMISFSYPKPDKANKYYEIFGLQPEFDAESNAMVFDSSTLLIPMKAFNPETNRVLKNYLNEELLKIEKSESITDKVKRVIHSFYRYKFPDIETVAKKLNMTTRSLQRKLSTENTTFQVLLQEAVFSIAKKLLRQNHLTISEVSYMLGYSDIGNFSRSFKKYTGKSPKEYKGA
jgi:AraC-like DNA-binding protein